MEHDTFETIPTQKLVRFMEEHNIRHPPSATRSVASTLIASAGFSPADVTAFVSHTAPKRTHAESSPPNSLEQRFKSMRLNPELVGPETATAAEISSGRVVSPEQRVRITEMIAHLAAIPRPTGMKLVQKTLFVRLGILAR